MDKNTQSALIMEHMDRQKKICSLIDIELPENEFVYSIMHYPTRNSYIMLVIGNTSNGKVYFKDLHVDEIVIKDLVEFKELFL